jgi:RNA polymerase sigma-70 factor (ECF subfamily)
LTHSDVPTDSDEGLAQRMRAGDAVAFAALATRYWSAVHRIARNMLPDQSKARDVAEETFLRALRSSHWFPRNTPFKVSLYRLAIIHSLIQRQPGPALRAGSPELAEQRDLVEQIRQGLEEVEDLDRAAFVLREIEQVKVEEAAEILRTSPGRIRESVHRVYLILTSLLGLLDRARARRLLESSLTRGGDD